MNILIQGSTILAIGPFTMTDTEIHSPDAVFPKHVVAGWQIVDATLPVNFAPGSHTYSNGVFTKIPPTAEAIAAAAEIARLQAIQDAIAGDTTLASLKAMSNADFDAWWAANVTTAVQAIGVLKRLFRVVLRRVL